MKNTRSSLRTGVTSPNGVPINSPVEKYMASAYLFHMLTSTMRASPMYVYRNVQLSVAMSSSSQSGASSWCVSISEHPIQCAAKRHTAKYFCRLNTA